MMHSSPAMARNTNDVVIGKLLNRSDFVWLQTSANEQIPAVHIRAQSPEVAARTRPEVEDPGAGWTILYSHGNAEDIALHLPFIEALSRVTGADVLSYEYVGYSLSRLGIRGPEAAAATASEDAVYRSIDAAWRYLTADCGVRPRDVIIYGRSIGSGPSVHLASRTEGVSGCAASPLGVRGVFLQSPVESAIRCALGYVSSLTLSSIDIFRNYEKVPTIPCPLALVHGTADSVAPWTGGRNLHATAQRPFPALWLEGYGHNDVPYDQIFSYLRKFLKTLKDDVDKTPGQSSAGPPPPPPSPPPTAATTR